MIYIFLSLIIGLSAAIIVWVVFMIEKNLSPNTLRRLEKIKRSVDHVLCIFPFEPELLAQHGIAATYVGHPLAGVIPLVPDRAAARAQLGLHDSDEVLAILPGDQRLDFRLLAAALGWPKLSLASPEEATRETGCVIGAIPPFSFSPSITLVASLARLSVPSAISGW